MSIIIFPQARREQIELILSELHKLKPQSENEKYAIEQNILFFKSIRSTFSYLHWLYKTRRHIRRADLLEINELLPDLDKVFHAKMAEIERRPRPGIIRPIVEYVTKLVATSSQDKRYRIVSLGSGSMEVERQVIEKLQKIGCVQSMTIVGFDISQNTRAFAAKNLSSLPHVRIVQETTLTKKRLSELERETKESVLIVVSGNDIFTLLSDFSSDTFDFAMTALFLHHLHNAARSMLIENMRSVARRTLNYDGYQNEFVLLPLSITGWHSPVFLNAAIFSSIRFPNRFEVQRLHTEVQIDFYSHGHYRAIFSS